MQSFSCRPYQSTGLSLWKTQLDPWKSHVRFMVGKVALGQGFLRAVLFPSVSFHPMNAPNTLIREVDKRLLTFGTGVLYLIQINHQPDATLFLFIILTFVYSSKCFGRQHDCHHDTKVKPEAATAVIKLLMLGEKTPETC